jgi:hypothetical protein
MQSNNTVVTDDRGRDRGRASPVRKHALIGGLHVKLQSSCGCGSRAATISGDATRLICSFCGRHRNPLSARVVDFLEKIVAAHGAPTSPIILRRNPD